MMACTSPRGTVRLSRRTISWSAIATCRFSTISALIIGKQNITNFAFFANADSRKGSPAGQPFCPCAHLDRIPALITFLFSQLRHETALRLLQEEPDENVGKSGGCVWPTVEPSLPLMSSETEAGS